MQFIQHEGDPDVFARVEGVGEGGQQHGDAPGLELISKVGVPKSWQRDVPCAVPWKEHHTHAVCMRELRGAHKHALDHSHCRERGSLRIRPA
eukprot:CAMPEP_0177635382 /NCGR_PEP_ID=MMETSP0447-20121125/3872_1 /TAXON_ID=0 /ORGANISM="Stygamoeba regulata, Strain BSH-02190019" /LENGTH=91 /DNA_ID=CAMNT_0019137167 /DNA_START=356 /DNA_END=627 /DNA_ORIENTATION=-